MGRTKKAATATTIVGVTMMVIMALSSGPSRAAPCWIPPVVGVVSDPFREPPCPYCAGNRGVEYRVAPRTAVAAVEAGVVSWSGEVAGTRYVVVRHADERRVTYGRLDSTPLSTGDRVVRGARVGTASGSFHLGLRVGDDYVDPAPLLGRLVGTPRLVPVDRTVPRAAPPPRLRCGAGQRRASAGVPVARVR